MNNEHLSPAMRVPNANMRERIPQEAIDDTVRQIAEKFDPKQIILFGSYAYGHPRPESDVDLLVVMDTPLKQSKQARKIRQAIKYNYGLDLLVRTPDTADEIRQIESEIDLMLYDFMKLSKNESILIEDVLSYSLDFFQEGERSKACHPAQKEDLLNYAQIFCKTINSILRFGQTTAWAAVYAGDSPLRVVSICFTSEHPAGTVITTDGSLDEMLHRINHKLMEEYTENVYLRRHLKLYNKYSIDIVKPNEKRFWSRSMALKDADALLAEGIALENHHVEQFA